MSIRIGVIGGSGLYDMVTYHARGTDEVTEREVSPQRLVYYRENWYLHAWCHLRKGLRNFAVDSIQRAEILEKHTRKIPERTVNAVLGPGYGIFAGQKLEWAKLRFSAERARWVSAEFWHPKQKGSFETDGSFVLEVPYADHRELLLDIHKYGHHVRVLAPESLRATVEEELRATLGGYTGND